MPRRKHPNEPKRVTRYTHDDVTDPASPETGHTPRIPDETVVELPMDNGWTGALEVGKLPDDGRTVVVDMDPLVDPVLMWAGKRNRRDIPLLPLQRTEIVSESRIARIIERARSAAAKGAPQFRQGSLFAGLEKELRQSEKDRRVDFYTHEEGWKNKLICGDSLEVMESLIRYEGLAGKVQMIYIDPPYGIGYNTNFQQRIDDHRANDERQTGDEVLTVKAFRDTWSLGLHSYLSYLQERLYVARAMLADSGSVFVQISDENLHLVRGIMDEVFGKQNFVRIICLGKTTGLESKLLNTMFDFILWYSKDLNRVKFRPVYREKRLGEPGATKYTRLMLADGTIRSATKDELASGVSPAGARFFLDDNLTSQGNKEVDFIWNGQRYKQGWKTSIEGMARLGERRRLWQARSTLRYIRFFDDFLATPISNNWADIGGIQSRSDSKVYVVQTSTTAIERCMLMTTDPGDLVLDPTCGSGTTVQVAEKQGRRWITCDVSRVAINVARVRLLKTLYPHYLLRGKSLSEGFEYETVRRVTLESIANDLEPEQVDLRDRPLVDASAVRVCGPFEVMTLGRYSIDDWRGHLVTTTADGVKLEDYIAVICRLYRKDASLIDSVGVIHAVVDRQVEGPLGISVGPISGRVTARQLNDAAREAKDAGIPEVHVLGWAFEANVGEVKDRLTGETGVAIELVMIRPDTLAEGLKVTQPEMLFSPLALPDVELEDLGNGEFAVTLKGVAVFDRKTRVTEYKHADSGYVAAWYLDEDYDGDCFVDCQMFFDFKKKPAIERTLKIEVDPEEWTLRLTSDPFKRGSYGQIAVKVVDVFGNESTVVKALP